VEGQLHGGITQGIGQALYEGAVYDNDGQLLSGSMMEYHVPSAEDVPAFDLDSTVTLTNTNPLGVKGIGEAGTIGSTPAAVNAVIDALSPLGIKHLDMPLTPEKLWRAIRASGGGTAMITHPFTYQAPTTIEEAVRALGGAGEAKVIAGGHSLLPLMKLGLAQPEMLVDLRRIASLGEIRTEADGTIAIGALATHRVITHDQTVRAKLTALAEAAGEVGDLQVRARGTIGGSLAHADPAADEPAPTIAFDATIRAVGPKGQRDIRARDYFKGTFETALAANEILVEIRFPAQPARTGSAYAKFAHPASRFAVTGVAAVVTIKSDGSVERAALGVTGAAAAAYRATEAERALTGTKGDAKAIAAAAAKAADGITALSDLVASSEYRKHLVTVYARRAIERAIERARA